MCTLCLLNLARNNSDWTGAYMWDRCWKPHILASTAVGEYDDEEEEDAIREDEDEEEDSTDSSESSEAGEIGRMALRY